jgi:hypothetical protein
VSSDFRLCPIQQRVESKAHKQVPRGGALAKPDRLLARIEADPTRSRHLLGGEAAFLYELLFGDYSSGSLVSLNQARSLKVPENMHFENMQVFGQIREIEIKNHPNIFHQATLHGDEEEVRGSDHSLDVIASRALADRQYETMARIKLQSQSNKELELSIFFDKAFFPSYSLHQEREPQVRGFLDAQGICKNNLLLAKIKRKAGEDERGKGIYINIDKSFYDKTQDAIQDKLITWSPESIPPTAIHKYFGPSGKEILNKVKEFFPDLRSGDSNLKAFKNQDLEKYEYLDSETKEKISTQCPDLAQVADLSPITAALTLKAPVLLAEAIDIDIAKKRRSLDATFLEEMKTQICERVEGLAYPRREIKIIEEAHQGDKAKLKENHLVDEIEKLSGEFRDLKGRESKGIQVFVIVPNDEFEKYEKLITKKNICVQLLKSKDYPVHKKLSLTGNLDASLRDCLVIDLDTFSQFTEQEKIPHYGETYHLVKLSTAEQWDSPILRKRLSSVRAASIVRDYAKSLFQNQGNDKISPSILDTNPFLKASFYRLDPNGAIRRASKKAFETFKARAKEHGLICTRGTAGLINVSGSSEVFPSPSNRGRNELAPFERSSIGALGESLFHRVLLGLGIPDTFISHASRKIKEDKPYDFKVQPSSGTITHIEVKTFRFANGASLARVPVTMAQIELAKSSLDDPSRDYLFAFMFYPNNPEGKSGEGKIDNAVCMLVPFSALREIVHNLQIQFSCPMDFMMKDLPSGHIRRTVVDPHNEEGTIFMQSTYLQALRGADERARSSAIVPTVDVNGQRIQLQSQRLSQAVAFRGFKEAARFILKNQVRNDQDLRRTFNIGTARLNPKTNGHDFEYTDTKTSEKVHVYTWFEKGFPSLLRGHKRRGVLDLVRRLSGTDISKQGLLPFSYRVTNLSSKQIKAIRDSNKDPKKPKIRHELWCVNYDYQEKPNPKPTRLGQMQLFNTSPPGSKKMYIARFNLDEELNNENLEASPLDYRVQLAYPDDEYGPFIFKLSDLVPVEETDTATKVKKWKFREDSNIYFPPWLTAWKRANSRNS